MLVTRRRSCGSVGPPSGGAVMVSVVLMRASVCASDAGPAPAIRVHSGYVAVRRVQPWTRGDAHGGRRSRHRPCAHCSRDATCGCGSSDEAATGPAALDRAVRWVHSSDLTDPTPFLSEGLVLLTTGTQFEAPVTSRAPTASTCSASRRAASSGSASAPKCVRDGIPPALAEACRERGMPLFEVPYRTPFIAVARANAEAIAAESYARRSWALAAQRAIALAALRPDGLGATLAELARQLGAWVGHVRRGW